MSLLLAWIDRVTAGVTRPELVLWSLAGLGGLLLALAGYVAYQIYQVQGVQDAIDQERGEG